MSAPFPPLSPAEPAEAPVAAPPACPSVDCGKPMEELSPNTYVCRCCNILRFREDLDIIAALSPKQALQREIEECYREDTTRGLDAPRQSQSSSRKAGKYFDARGARNQLADRAEHELSNVFGCRMKLEEIEELARTAAACRVTPSELVRKALGTVNPEELRTIEPPRGLTKSGSKDLSIRLTASQSIAVYELARDMQVRASEVLRRVALLRLAV